MAAEYHHHVLVPMALGARNLSLSSKILALLHALHLTCGTWELTRIICRTVHAVCTDYGTESGLASVPDLNVDAAFPWWQERPITSDDAEDLDSPLCLPVRVSFANAMQVPGIEHTCHNALAQITKKLAHYESWLVKATALGRCLSSTYYTDRLKTLCLASSEAREVADMVDAFQVKPDKGRFGNLMEFLDQALPLKQGLQRFYRDDAFRGDDLSDPTDPDHSVDVNLVTRFIVDDESWHYGTMLLCLGAAWLEVAYYSRSCSCHVAKYVDGANAFTYHQRRAAQQRATGLQGKCPATGLHADEFAAGKAMDILRETTAKYSRLLTADLAGVTREGRHRIMRDFDLGCDQSYYLGSLKFSTHRQLPLVLCGMANRDLSKAKQCAQVALDEWHLTSESSAHGEGVRAVFEDPALLSEIEEFADTGIEQSKPRLQELLDEVDMVRFNELSVEGLHRVGSLAARLSAHHGPAYVANHLRCPEISSRGGGRWTWEDFAETCTSLAGTKTAVKLFGFERHPLMMSSEDELRLKGLTGYWQTSYKAMMQMFYRTDPFTMFDANVDTRTAIKEHSDKIGAALKAALAQPLAQRRLENSSAEQKAEAVVVQYALRHFKDWIIFCLRVCVCVGMWVLMSLSFGKCLCVYVCVGVFVCVCLFA